jgi:N-methylhydantoinase A
MEPAIRTISVERGYDPRDFTLLAFGGAGPLHACELAATLHLPRVLIPPNPGVLSALGMVLADAVKDYSQTVMLPIEQADPETLDGLFAPLCEHARADLLAEGFPDDAIMLLPALDMRYVGQSFELKLEITKDLLRPTANSRFRDPESELAERFHALHRQRFSYASEGEAVELVNLRVKAIGHTAKPSFSPRPLGSPDPRVAHVGYKQVHFTDRDSAGATRLLSAALYQRERLVPGHMIIGPAIVFQLDTTTVIPPDWVARVDGLGNLILEAR